DEYPTSLGGMRVRGLTPNRDETQPPAQAIATSHAHAAAAAIDPVAAALDDRAQPGAGALTRRDPVARARRFGGGRRVSAASHQRLRTRAGSPATSRTPRRARGFR